MVAGVVTPGVQVSPVAGLAVDIVPERESCLIRKTVRGFKLHISYFLVLNKFKIFNFVIRSDSPPVKSRCNLECKIFTAS